jgi:predicted GNAT family N-acyltransferase
MLEGVSFKPASPAECQLALALREEVYLRDLGHVPDDGLDNRSDHLVGILGDGNVVAAVRIVGPEHRPFDFETFCDPRHSIQLGPAPALIGRLCVRSDYRAAHRSAFLHIGLLRLAVEFGLAKGLSDYILYTYPNLIRFYSGGLFRLVGMPFEHPDWGLIHLMHLNLLELKNECADSPIGRLLFSEQ